MKGGMMINIKYIIGILILILGFQTLFFISYLIVKIGEWEIEKFDDLMESIKDKIRKIKEKK